MSRIVTCISSSFHVVFVIVISRMNYVIEWEYGYMVRGCYGAICTVSPQANNPGDAEEQSSAVGQ